MELHVLVDLLSWVPIATNQLAQMKQFYVIMIALLAAPANSIAW
jgi:hypothetical protein